jgi:hypothetical protein
MNYFSIILQVIKLAMGVFEEVHTVQQTAGLSGADKSQHVIDKVTPIASALGAEQEHVQNLIDGAVGIYKSLGLKGFTAGAQGAPGDSLGG